MDQIYPDAALVPLALQDCAGAWDYHLFTNNVTSGLAALLSSFTEATWTGYAVITVTQSQFTITGVSGHIGTIQAAPIAFNNTSGGSVTAYGYFVTDSVTGDLICFAIFDGGPLTILNGGSLQVIPLHAQQSRYAS
jgi:hypothetical protein